MDIKRKLFLSETYESYWLMLPPEIQECILVFKISQDVIEERKKKKKTESHDMSRNRRTT